MENKNNNDETIDDIPMPQAIRSFSDDFDEPTGRAEMRTSAEDVKAKLAKYAPIEENERIFGGIPLGVKIISGLMAINAAYNLWQAATSSEGDDLKASATVAVFALLFSFGLFFMSNFARRAFIVFSTLCILYNLWLYHAISEISYRFDGSTVTLVHVMTALNVVYFVSIITYLMRPSIKERF